MGPKLDGAWVRPKSYHYVVYRGTKQEIMFSIGKCLVVGRIFARSGILWFGHSRLQHQFASRPSDTFF
jgi:hypothetical protein